MMMHNVVRSYNIVSATYNLKSEIIALKTKSLGLIYLNSNIALC